MCCEIGSVLAMDDVARQSGSAVPGPFGRWWRSLFAQVPGGDAKDAHRHRTKVLPGKWPTATTPLGQDARAGEPMPPKQGNEQRSG
jgi:hypothetical protein